MLGSLSGLCCGPLIEAKAAGCGADDAVGVLVDGLIDVLVARVS
jgi:hypothetical protein